MSVEGADFLATRGSYSLDWEGPDNGYHLGGPWKAGSGGQAGTSCSNAEVGGWASSIQAGGQRWTGRAGSVKRPGQG